MPPGLQLQTGEGGGLGWRGGARVGEVESEPREGRGLGEPGRLRSENEKPAKARAEGKGDRPQTQGRGAGDGVQSRQKWPAGAELKKLKVTIKG